MCYIGVGEDIDWEYPSLHKIQLLSWSDLAQGCFCRQFRVFVCRKLIGSRMTVGTRLSADKLWRGV